AVKVLDVNTGTGIWAIRFAESNPDSKVIGIDTDRMHPPNHPPNVSFRKVDVMEGPWKAYELPEKFDFVHCQLLIPTPINFDCLYQSCFNALSAGGVLELEEMRWYICSDDNTIPPKSSLVHWVNMLKCARQTSYEETKTRLESIVFINVTFEEVKLPINPGSLKHDQNDILDASQSEQLPSSWFIPRNKNLAIRVQKEIQRVSIHAYFCL
ncbi:hypothetical protein LY76DRAFT_512376, partial [Colletotrichum caudatum]